jgi:chemotaxis protein MotB
MDEEEEEKCPEGIPAWVMTFADLMSLLMCFFVLLFSFAVMDATKFREMNGALKKAFGVQQEVFATSAPMGTSIIKQHFSPGKPDEPTILDEIKQKTTEEVKEALEVPESVEAEVESEVETVAAGMKEELEEEIQEDMVEVVTDENRIIIRLKEKAAFRSGSAVLNKQFKPVIAKIKTIIQDESGPIVIAGHTDPEPISTFRYRSNWDLSSARAVSVLHELIKKKDMPISRFHVEGHGSALPIMPNDTPENRSKNRRVEVVIIQKEAQEKTP